MTDATLREIEDRRRELLEQRKAFRGVQSYLDGVIEALDRQINDTFDEWAAAFDVLHPDLDQIPSIQAGVDKTPSDTSESAEGI